MIDIERWKERAENYYDKLPYHNFDHALKVLEAAEGLIKRCKNYDVPVNEDVVRLAALFHDAGYADDVPGIKESHSARIAQEELFTHIPDVDVERVTEAILATHVDAPLHTVEDKILRAADLRALAADYETFEKNSDLLEHEYELLSGHHPDHDAWKRKAKELIENYLKVQIRITPEFNDDEFHAKVRANLEIYLKR